MPKIRSLCLVLLALILWMAGCAPAPNSTAASGVYPPTLVAPQPSQTAMLVSSLIARLESLPADSFFDQSYARLLGRNPELLTTLGISRVYGSGNNRLTDLSDGYLRQTQQLESGILALLNKYDRAALSPSQRLTADIYAWYLQDRVNGQPYLYDDYPINPVVVSIHNDLLLFFTDMFPFQSAQDARDYVTCLEQVGAKLDQVLVGLKRRTAGGVILPRFLIPYMVSDLQRIGRSSAAATPFYTTLAEKIKTVSGLSADEQRALLDAAEKEIGRTVTPAFQRLADYLNGLQAQASNDAGIWKIPDGAAYYSYLLRHYTTTNMTADQVYEMGSRELVRIQAEMRALFARLGYPAGESLPALYNRLAADGGMVSSQQIVTTYDQLISAADKLSQDSFGLKPYIGVKVMGGPTGGYYTPPALDGSRPGYFYAQNTGSIPRFGMATLAYHEAIPGHHTQTAIQQKLKLPGLRQGMDFTAYVEGWALYAERLMGELGAYMGDPYGDLGRLQAEAFRASRLVIDTGIHAKKWTYQQAVDFMIANTGMGSGQVQNEVSRYVSWPGQATAYYVGFQKILELRQKAKDALGSRFNLAEFHNVVLGSGAVPLEILEQIVKQYIDGKR